MQSLAHVGVLILETIFFIGVVGSSIVVAISFVEDIQTLFEE